MWVQRWSSSEILSQRERRGDKPPRGRKGKNVHVLAFNVCQHIYGRGPGTDQLQSCALPIPTQVLPKANAATIDDRVKKWSLLDWELGRRYADVVHGPELANAVDDVRDGVTLITRDGLGTNQAVVNMIGQRVHRRRHSAAGLRVMLDITCGGHSLCLSSKPTLDRISNGRYRTVLVKLGHHFESARKVTSLKDAVDNVVDDERFLFVPLPTRACLPPAFGQWAKRARDIMYSSRSATGMTQAHCDDILEFDNGDWQDTRFVYYCVRGECRYRCENAKEAKMTMRAKIKFSLQDGPGVPLEYRHKGMERANSYMVRVRGQHDCLRQVMEHAHPIQIRRLAEQAAASLAANNEDQSFPVKNSVRAHFLISYFDQPGEFDVPFQVAATMGPWKQH